MKPHSLATILVKVLGLSLCISGSVSIVYAITWFMVVQQRQASQLSWYSFQPLTTSGINGIMETGIGLFLIIKTSHVVEKWLKIKADE